MPAQAAEIRKQVKQWGDVMMGIPTQCLVSKATSLNVIELLSHSRFIHREVENGTIRPKQMTNT